MRYEFKLPENEKELQDCMRENMAHRLLKIEGGMVVLTGEDIPLAPVYEN